jgi:hypothetical protein
MALPSIQQLLRAMDETETEEVPLLRQTQNLYKSLRTRKSEECTPLAGDWKRLLVGDLRSTANVRLLTRDQDMIRAESEKDLQETQDATEKTFLQFLEVLE